MIRNITATAQFDRACDEAGKLAADVQALDSRAEFSFDCTALNVVDGKPEPEWSLCWNFASHDLRDSLLRGLVRAMVRTMGIGTLWMNEAGYIVDIRVRKIGGEDSCKLRASHPLHRDDGQHTHRYMTFESGKMGSLYEGNDLDDAIKTAEHLIKDRGF